MLKRCQKMKIQLKGLNVLLMAYFSKLFHFLWACFHSVLFNPPPVNVSVNMRVAVHVTFLDTSCTSIINVKPSNCKINK